MFIRLRNNGEVKDRELGLISHRGGKGFGPENTLQSLQGALEYGVEMVETDVRTSGDGVPLIHHGPFLGLHLLGSTPMSEIRERAPDIPTLQEYLDLAGGRCSLNLEVKRCDPSRLAEVLDGNEQAPTILVSSFDADFLAMFRQTGSPVELGLLSQYEPSAAYLLREAERCGATTLLPVSFRVKGELVEVAHAAGLNVITWTVNSTGLVEEVVAAGVDGIITDTYPELRDYLESGILDIRRDKVDETGDNGKQP